MGIAKHLEEEANVSMVITLIDADHEQCDFCGRVIPKGFGGICAGCLNNACEIHGDARVVIAARDARAAARA